MPGNQRPPRSDDMKAAAGNDVRSVLVASLMAAIIAMIVIAAFKTY